MAEATAHRFESIDVIKGFIILVVVCGHLMVSSTGSESDRGLPLFMQICYLGLMSFFIISGYFFRPGRGFVENMKRRGIQLALATAICAVVLPIITYIWLAICGQTSDPSDILRAIIGAFQLHDPLETLGPVNSYVACASSVGYYFLWAMMGGFIIFYALADYVMDDKMKLALTIIALTAIFMAYTEYCPVRLPFFFQLAPLAALFMFAGAILARMKIIERIEEFQWKTLNYWKPFLICFVAGVVLCNLLPPGIKFDWAIFGDYGGLSVVPFIIEAVLMFVVYVYIAKFVAQLPLLPRLFNIAGQHTLGMLLYHGFLATIILAPFYTIPTTSWFPAEMGLTNRIALAVVVIILSLVICIYGPKLLDKVRGRGKAFKDTSEESS